MNVKRDNIKKGLGWAATHLLLINSFSGLLLDSFDSGCFQLCVLGKRELRGILVVLHSALLAQTVYHPMNELTPNDGCIDEKELIISQPLPKF